MPGTDTTAVGARWHVFGDLERSVDLPNTFVVDTENSQILGLDAVHIGGIGDGEGATLQVILALGGNE